MLPADLPEDLPTFLARFGTDSACREHLFRTRWPNGFRCAGCDNERAYAHKRRLIYECTTCKKQHSLLAGTLFEQTKTGLSKWFLAIYFVTSSKGGIAAAELKRHLGFGSDQTAWTWLHKIRRAMVVANRKPLDGPVEADEMAIGGPRPGKRGRGAAGKTIVAVAVEKRSLTLTPRDPDAPSHKPLRGKARQLAKRAFRTGKKVRRCFGRARLERVHNARGATLEAFLGRAVAPSATVATDGHKGYLGLDQRGYAHEPINLSKASGPAHEYLPATHLVASLVKRWLLGTHHGGVSSKYLQRYLDEYVFRFNRRCMKTIVGRCLRLIDLAIATAPAPYWLICGKMKST